MALYFDTEISECYFAYDDHCYLKTGAELSEGRREEKIILYLGGGGIAGIFSGGVLAGLQEADFYGRIEAIYAGSAGAMNAAYFLSKQTQIGATIYLDDLTSDFILPKNIPIGIMKLICNKHICKLPKDKSRFAVDIDYVMDIIANKKPLRIDELKKQKIDFFVKLLNVRTKKVEYLNAKEYDLLSLLRATSCIVPYYPFSENVNGNDYVDGTIKEPIGLRYLLEKHPGRRIVIILNSFLKRRFSNYARCFAEGVVSHFFDYSLFGMYVKREHSLRKDLNLISSFPEVTLICPPENSPVIAMTQDRNKLLETFEIGRKMADKI